MRLFEKIINKILLKESVSIEDVNNAIDNHERVIINYHSKGEDKNTGARVIEVYAYGTTKAGNPCIRAFEPYGDTTTKVPAWKFFRLDRITAWKETGQKFSEPASDYYKGIGDFNPNGDESMATVFKIAKFDNAPTTPQSGPRLKNEPDVYRTDTERGMNRTRQQLANPITISDIKTKDAFRNYEKENEPQSGPRLKNEPQKTDNTNQEQEIYKTDTERAIERLRKQLENPKKIDLSQFNKPKKTPQQQEEVPQEQQPKEEIPQSGPRLKNEPQVADNNNSDNVYKTDTERAIERLRQQLNNPRKIDLSKIPRR